MNCKLEKFWNTEDTDSYSSCTIMNCKLEKFWNNITKTSGGADREMNCKLEKFWNSSWFEIFISISSIWTVNLKSFEMLKNLKNTLNIFQWTVNLKSFEIKLRY